VISKYNGRCKGCGKAYTEGTDIYWTKEDGGWHWECRDSGAATPEAHALADRLRFIRSGEPISIEVPDESA
jgi:hypothetical protein